MRKFILVPALCFAMLLFAGIAHAAVLPYSWALVVDELNQPISSDIKVQVNTTAGTAATIYSDRYGVDTKTNPISNPANGIVGFYYDGNFDLVISNTSATKARTLTYNNLTVTDHRVVFPRAYDVTTHPYDTITGSTTLTATSKDYQMFSVTAGTYTVVLPSTATVQGKNFYFKHLGITGSVLYLDPDGSQTIDGATYNNAVDAKYDCLGIMSVAGEGWAIVEYRIQ